MRNKLTFLLIVTLLANAAAPVFKHTPSRQLDQQPGEKKPATVPPPNPDKEAPVKDSGPAGSAGSATTKGEAKKPKPGEATGDTTTQVLKFIRNEDDADPATLYQLIFGAIIWRAWASIGLFKQVPDSSRAGMELSFWGTNSEELKKAKAAYAALKKNSPEKLKQLEAAAKTYGAHLMQIEGLVAELRKDEKIANDKKTVGKLDAALQAWQTGGDFGPLNAFILAERHPQTGRLRFKSGQQWLRKFDAWSENERAAIAPIATAWNAIHADVNPGMIPTEQKASLQATHDAGYSVPGKVYLNGVSPIKAADAYDTMTRNCKFYLKALAERKMDLRGKVGPFGFVGQGYKLVSPLGNLGLTVGTVWLLNKTHDATVKRYGKTPEVAVAENKRAATVENEINLRADASLEAQVEKHKADFAPFVDLMAQNLYDNQDAILESIAEYQKLNPDVKVNMARKRALFSDKEQLKKNVRAAMRAGGEQLGKDVSADQILSFLALVTKPETRKSSVEDYNRFLYAMYGKFMDNAFPEVEAADGEQKPGTGTASQYFSKMYKNELVPKLLPELRKMKIAEPANVTPLPVLPVKQVPEATGGKEGISNDKRTQLPGDKTNPTTNGNLVTVAKPALGPLDMTMGMDPK